MEMATQSADGSAQSHVGSQEVRETGLRGCLADCCRRWGAMVCHATSNTGHGQQANDRGKWEGEQSWVCFWQLPLTSGFIV